MQQGAVLVVRQTAFLLVIPQVAALVVQRPSVENKNKYFRRYQRILKPKVKMLNRKSALDELKKIEKPLRAKMEAMLEAQNMVMKHDSWMDSGKRTCVSAT